MYKKLDGVEFEVERLKCALFRKAISRWWNAFIKELLWLPAKWILFETAKLVGFHSAFTSTTTHTLLFHCPFLQSFLLPPPLLLLPTTQPVQTHIPVYSFRIEVGKVGRTGNVGNRKWNPSEKIAEDEIGTKRLKRSGRRRYITSKVFRNCKSSHSYELFLSLSLFLFFTIFLLLLLLLFFSLVL